MIRGEELDLRESLVYDAYVKEADSDFWKGDTANVTYDTARFAVSIGDTGAAGSMTSFSQYQYGDFEFSMLIDSLSPDSNDSEKYFGLRNPGDTLNRGAAYFDLSYDTVAGDSSANARSFRAVVYDDFGNRQEKDIVWDTDWGGGARLGRFRIKWEVDGYNFYVNDTIVANMGDRDSNDGGNATAQIGSQIPQALRVSNRSLDTTAGAETALKAVTIRNARKII